MLYSLFAAKANDNEYTYVLKDKTFAEILNARDGLGKEWVWVLIRNEVYYTPPLYRISGSTSYIPDYICQRSEKG